MSVNLDQARIIADTSLVKGRELGLKPLSVVVIDPRTSIVACLSEDGCSQMRQRIALGKAKAAIQLGIGTRALMKRAEEQAYFIQSMNGLAGGDNTAPPPAPRPASPPAAAPAPASASAHAASPSPAAPGSCASSSSSWAWAAAWDRP